MSAARLTPGSPDGLRPVPVWVAPALSAVLIAVMYAVDHPRSSLRTQRHMVTLDAAYPDRACLGQALETLLRADVRHFVGLERDLVRHTTVVDVRFRIRPSRTPTPVRRSDPQPWFELQTRIDRKYLVPVDAVADLVSGHPRPADRPGAPARRPSWRRC